MNSIRAIREGKGLSKMELAMKTGVGERYIAFLETGERTPSLSLAMKISEALDASMDDLFLSVHRRREGVSGHGI